MQLSQIAAEERPSGFQRARDKRHSPRRYSPRRQVAPSPPIAGATCPPATAPRRLFSRCAFRDSSRRTPPTCGARRRDPADGRPKNFILPPASRISETASSLTAVSLTAVNISFYTRSRQWQEPPNARHVFSIHLPPSANTSPAFAGNCPESSNNCGDSPL